MRKLVVLVVFVTLALTESALASRASVESTDVGPMITIVGGDENSNIWIADGSLWIHDDAGITADMGCTQETATAVDCGLGVPPISAAATTRTVLRLSRVGYLPKFGLIAPQYGVGNREGDGLLCRRRDC